MKEMYSLNKQAMKMVKQKLLGSGLKRATKLGSLNFFLNRKHYERYVDKLRWLKTESSIERDIFSLELAYKIDIVTRQEITHVLQPVELSIITALSNFFEFEDGYGTVASLTRQKNFFDHTIIKSHRAARRLMSTESFVTKAIIKVVGMLKRKKERPTIYNVFSNLTFGQVQSFIEVLDEDLFGRIFPKASTNKRDFSNTLNMVVSLRNHVAHVQPILSIKKVRHVAGSFDLPHFIDAMSLIARGDFKKDLRSRMTAYRKRTLQKLNGKDEANAVKIFDLAEKFIFGGK